MCVKVTTECANGGLDNDDKELFKQEFLDDEHKTKNKIALVRNPSRENYIITRPEASKIYDKCYGSMKEEEEEVNFKLLLTSSNIRHSNKESTFTDSTISYNITCITLDLQDQPTSTVSEPTCPSRRHPFTSMTCGPAIGPIDHFVGNGATQPTAPPTVEHLGMHDVPAHAAVS
ncbi:hypothetical protein SFRURICE_017594 [Spodoptera frugiperda]|nr:hypothetical protein SFRURICE_017594 [Spodoptera frugiperda]